MDSFDLVARIAVAALGGAAIGVERQHSGHASGPHARFGGVRTFALLGLTAGISGTLWAAGAGTLAIVPLAGAAALVIASYVAAMHDDIDATTEAAAMVVLAAGVLAGSGQLTLSSGIIAVTALLLVEKSRLHALVGRIDPTDLRAAVRFAVMAVVILPLLPEGPIGPLGGVRPRQLWAVVLFFSGLSFAGYIARRIVGPAHGYALTGLLGGLLSSTSVTLTHARASRAIPGHGPALASGVLAACTVLVPRVLVAVAVLAPMLVRPLTTYLAIPLAVGLAGSVAGLWFTRDSDMSEDTSRNPLQLSAALQMALLFQLVLFAVSWARGIWGSAGLVASGAVLGLTDVDALTISMARAAEAGAVIPAARAIAVGVLSNTLLKLALVLVIGHGAFRGLAAGGLLAMAVASAAGLWLFW